MTAWALPTRASTWKLGRAVGASLRPGSVVALIGELGAGKTTLAQAIASGMGVASPVSSPTFGLIHEYAGAIPLFHLDTYRLSSADELAALGFHEYFDRGGVVLVEWADRFPEILPTERLTIRIEIDPEALGTEPADDAPRRLEAEAAGHEYAELLAGITTDPELHELLRTE
jgi:tRNA threonylcarbamoyladenosine biosynthesis protein TsaE